MSRSRILLCLSTFLLLGMMFTGTANAQSCECDPPTPEEAVEQADIVFLGEVTETGPVDLDDVEFAGRVLLEPDMPYSSLALLRSVTVWKGPVYGQFEVYGGTGEGCTVNFEFGEQYVVFGTGGGTDVLETSQCTGTVSLADAESSGLLDELGDGTEVSTETIDTPVDQRGGGTRQDSWIMFSVGAGGLVIGLVSMGLFLWLRKKAVF